MVTYLYDGENECFKRDYQHRGGKPLYVNVSEAQRIVTLIDLGYPTESIIDKVNLVNPKASKTTVRSFIKNYKNGAVMMPTDAPVPSMIFEDMTDDQRISDLEKRVSELEMKISEFEKPKSWRERLGI